MSPELTIIGIVAAAITLIGIALCLGVIVMTLMQSRQNNEDMHRINERYTPPDPAIALAAAEAAAAAAAAAKAAAEQNHNGNHHQEPKP